MTWNPIDDPVDYYVLAGERSPGVSHVAGANAPRKWDEVGGYGISGSTLFYRGNGIAKFSAKTLLTTPEEWEQWHSFKRLLARETTLRRPRALDIWHPYLEDIEVSSVVVQDRTQPEQIDDGLWVVTVQFMQHRRRKFSLVKAEGSEASSSDPVDEVIENLTGRLEALSQ